MILERGEQFSAHYPQNKADLAIVMHARGYFSKTVRGLMEWGCLTAVVSPPFLLLPVTTGGPNNQRPTNLSTTLPIREELDKPSKKSPHSRPAPQFFHQDHYLNQEKVISLCFVT